MRGMNINIIINIKIPLENYFLYLSKKEFYCTLNTCLIVFVLFPTKWHLRNSFICSCSNNIPVFPKPCAKIETPDCRTTASPSAMLLQCTHLIRVYAYVNKQLFSSSFCGPNREHLKILGYLLRNPRQCALLTWCNSWNVLRNVMPYLFCYSEYSLIYIWFEYIISPRFLITRRKTVRHSGRMAIANSASIAVTYCKSDVWLTVHRNSVWIRKTN